MKKRKKTTRLDSIYGLALTAPLNPNPRFKSEDDLWKEKPHTSKKNKTTTKSFMTSKECVKEALKNNPKKSKVSLMGCLADPSFHVTEEDIAEVRKEMWGSIDKKWKDEPFESDNKKKHTHQKSKQTGKKNP